MLLLSLRSLLLLMMMKLSWWWLVVGGWWLVVVDWLRWVLGAGCWWSSLEALELFGKASKMWMPAMVFRDLNQVLPTLLAAWQHWELGWTQTRPFTPLHTEVLYAGSSLSAVFYAGFTFGLRTEEGGPDSDRSNQVPQV